MSRAEAVTWVDPQTGKVWTRKGDCKHCGGCCTVQCPYFYFVVNVDLKAGDKIAPSDINDSGKLASRCSIFDSNINGVTATINCLAETRKKYPVSPLQTPEYCSFYWVDERGNVWSREKVDYSKGA